MGLCLRVAVLVLITTTAVRAELDSSRYIDIDEVKPGMEAFCLTVFEGTRVEKFPLDVVSVVRDIAPGRNAILVRGTDERFMHFGPVSGCSGSPVYIEGRLAGALAFAWSFSKDPLYGVTPINEMLEVGKGRYEDAAARTMAIDFSKPVDLTAIWKTATTAPLAGRHSASTMSYLPLPLAVSLPQPAIDRLAPVMEPLGFVPVSAGGGVAIAQTERAELTPGAALAIPLVTGDISMSAVGTVTEVADGKFYAFGHSLLGYGKIELPVGPAYIHTVVASLSTSFKIGDATEVTGTLTRDEETGIYGIIGSPPPMVDLKITVERYNDTRKRIYNCKVARDDYLTPMLVNSVIGGAALAKGDLPPEHSVRYEARIRAKNAPEINVANISTDSSLTDVLREVVAPTSMLINNPFRKVDIESIDVAVTIDQKSQAGSMEGFAVSRNRLKAGESIEATAEVRLFRSGSRKYSWQVTIPKELPPGACRLMVMGPDAYLKFLVQAAPYRFSATSFDGVMSVIRNVLAVRRDRLYSVLLLPSGGLTIERTVLPDLPAGKAVLLADPSRTFRVQPFQQWNEQQIPVEGIVSDARAVDITVEE